MHTCLRPALGWPERDTITQPSHFHLGLNMEVLGEAISTCISLSFSCPQEKEPMWVGSLESLDHVSLSGRIKALKDRNLACGDNLDLILLWLKCVPVGGRGAVSSF